MNIHELANLIPVMSQEQYKQLKDDIGENGLLEPITIYDGKILDGRHRYRAVEELGITPKFTEFTGDYTQAKAYVLSLNVHRRHLSYDQRCALAYLDKKQIQESGVIKAGNPHVESNLGDFARIKGASRIIVAERFNVGQKAVSEAETIAKVAPDIFEKMLDGNIKLRDAQREVRSREIQEARQEISKAGSQVEQSDKWRVYHGDIASWQTSKQYDFIITDPPYPKEYLHLYETLAIRANEWLKDGGLLIVMCGQSYLNEIYAMMSKHLDYYWTASYLTPGQPTPLRQVNVNTTWKPILIFKKSKYTGKIFGDVFTSDGNDKDFHKWGQSISGMYSIISNICLEGQSILDPFCGAGTTLIAGLKHNCLVDGIDIDIENVNISKGRLNDYTEKR